MKAILVIDVPVLDDGRHLCNECPLWNRDRFLCEYDFNMNANGCPLKPLPKKKEVEVNEIEDLISTEYTVEDFYDKYVAKIRLATDKMIALGWNACLKEIEDGER